MNNFTPRAQQVLALARKEADRLRHLRHIEDAVQKRRDDADSAKQEAATGEQASAGDAASGAAGVSPLQFFKNASASPP